MTEILTFKVKNQIKLVAKTTFKSDTKKKTEWCNDQSWKG